MCNVFVLDSASGIDFNCNSKCTHNVTPTVDIDPSTNGGGPHITQKAELPNFEQVNYHSEALTNILLLASTADNKFQATLDSVVDNTFCVHTPERRLDSRETKCRT